MSRWKVVLEPRDENPSEETGGQNVGGIVIFLDDGNDKHEVSRVAYVRRNSKNSRVSFKKQLAMEVEKAQISAEELNRSVSERERILSSSSDAV